jgi:hypothetical protein
MNGDNVKLVHDFHQEQAKAMEAHKKLADAQAMPPPPPVDLRQCKDDNERLHGEVERLGRELKKMQDKTAGVQESLDSSSPGSADEVNSCKEETEKMQGENTRLLEELKLGANKNRDLVLHLIRMQEWFQVADDRAYALSLEVKRLEKQV